MSTFPDWHKHAATQKHLETGCIPTAYQSMLQAAGATGIDFATFQEDFDLDLGGGAPQNNFGSVADAVKAKYPDVEFTQEPFATGKEKLERLEELLAQGQQVLVSITNEPEHGPGYGWHIMPVVDFDADSLAVLEYMPADRNPVTTKISKKNFVDYHDNYAGGKEIAHLKSWQ